MSNSEPTDFDRWIAAAFRDTGGFTALILLLEIGTASVEPMSCAYLHVIGPDVDWAQMRGLLDAARRPWQGVAFFVQTAPGGGPVIDIVAKASLQEQIDAVTMNRMRLNDAGLFDRLGRAIRFDPVAVV